MATSEEYMKILKMVETGKITAEEAARLLAALGETRGPTGAGGSPAGDARWFRVRVSDAASGKTKVNLNLPMGLVNFGLKVGAKFIPENEGLDPHDILQALKTGGQGKIIDVTDEEEGEHMEIFVE